MPNMTAAEPAGKRLLFYRSRSRPSLLCHYGYKLLFGKEEQKQTGRYKCMLK